jgi:CHAT domain-containing protein/tetratricopeptide (TPR) repeat protein
VSHLPRRTARSAPLLFRRLALFAIAASCVANIANAQDAQEITAAAESLQAKGDYRTAAQQYERALALAPAAFGPDHLFTGEICNNLGITYAALGEYAKAEPLYERALKIRAGVQGADGPLIADTLNNLAVLYWNMGQLAKAASVFERSIKLYEANYGPDHVMVARTLSNLATVYKDLGQYAKAEPLYLRCLKIYQATIAPDDPYVAKAMTLLGCVYRDRGQFAKAGPLLNRSVEILEAKRGSNHPEVADALNNLAVFYRSTGQVDKAVPLYQRCIRIDEANFGPDHPSVALELNNLALLYADAGMYADALPLYQRCLKIAEAKLGPDHPNLASVLDNLANLYDNMGQPANAEALYQRSLKIVETKLGADHPLVATSSTNLANLYQSLGQFEKAETLYRRALAVDQARLGADHPDTARFAWHNLAMLHAASERWSDAAADFDRSRRIIRRHIARTLPQLNETDQLTFLGIQDVKELHTALSLGLLRRSDPAIVERSAAWLLNGKAVAQEALTQRARLTNAAFGNPNLQELVQQLLRVRSAIAALGMTAADAGHDAERREGLEQLKKLEQSYSDRLTEAGIVAAEDDPWVEPATVRKALPGDAVLVDIARFAAWSFGRRGESSHRNADHYAAWIITPDGQGQIDIVDLGEAEKIDCAIQAGRAAFQSPQSAIGHKAAPQMQENGRATSQEQAPPSPAGKPTARGLDFGPATDERSNAAMQSLAKLIFEPLQSHFGKAQQLIISPDSNLWLVPWEALLLADGKYVIEKYKISYVVSGRDLLASTVKNAHAPAVPVIFADPDYDLSPDEVAAATNAVFRDNVAERVPAIEVSGNASPIPKVARLPGTAAEAKAVEPKLKEYCHADPVAYTDRYALEGVFKELVGPRVVVLSTHGFVLADQIVAESNDRSGGLAQDRSIRAALSTDGQPLQNPLLRCGLLLAGCNQRRAGRIDALGDDGILTGFEIAGADLRGTELVVLSACETGLGEVNTGEGVAGLRQAFQLAGAKAVVATLWKIPDRETATLMSDFFANLAAGQSKSDALRNAQLKFIEGRRKEHGAAPPFYWAAFTLTGQ